jgi:polysaccharide deacetylase family protein (PEP-CTERM system associated)
MQKLNILTIDFEDWFNILNHPYNDDEAWHRYESRLEDNTRTILALLEKHRMKATFFALGWFADHHPHIIKEIADKGHELGLHTYYHQQMDTFSADSFLRDLYQTKEAIFKACGREAKAFRAPGFSVRRPNVQLLQLLKEVDISVDSSIVPGFHTYGRLPWFKAQGPVRIRVGDAELDEFPVSTVGIRPLRFIYSGGGYFRLIPLWVNDMIIRSKSYQMFYFHPRDFDPQQPRVPCRNPVRKWKLYQHLHTTYPKLDRMLGQIKTIPIYEARKQVDWTKVSVYDLGTK